jgi:hypothetical protein
MAPRAPRTSRIATVVLAGAATYAVVSHHSPAYAVKGSWEGAATALKPDEYDTILKGLEPEVKLPAITFAREGLALSVEDNHLNAGYTSTFGQDKTLELRVNDDQEWRAGLRTSDAALRVKGKGSNLDHLFWEASQSGSVEGVGDVLLEFNSDKNYNLTVSQPDLGEFLETKFGAKVRATNNGFTGVLRARRELPGNAAVSYSVENPVGVYNLDKSHHVAEITAPVAGGQAALRATHEDSKQAYLAAYSRSINGGRANFQVSHKNEAIGYNVSYARGLDDILPVDAGLLLGLDEDGVYSKLTARRQLANNLDAEYEARARVATSGDDHSADLAHSLKLSNKLGYAQLLHGSGGSPRVRVGYEFNA